MIDFMLHNDEFCMKCSVDDDVKLEIQKRKYEANLDRKKKASEVQYSNTTFDIEDEDQEQEAEAEAEPVRT